MTIKDVLIRHIQDTFEKETWQPPLTLALDGLTAKQAAWKPAPERHSIWQIVKHIIHWKRGVLEAWDGNPPDYKEMERGDWVEASGDDAVWQVDVQALREVTAKIRERVEAADETRLTGPLATYKGLKNQTAVIRLMSVATHDIYHAGQIRYIRALQGV